MGLEAWGPSAIKFNRISTASVTRRPRFRPSPSVLVSTGARPHAPQNVVMPDKMVPECCQSVNAGEREQGVRQIAVNVLGGMKDGAVATHSEIDPEQTEVKGAAVPDE